MGIVIHTSSQIDEFGRRVLDLLESELAALDVSGFMFTIVQTGENPHPVVTVIRQKATRSFQVDYEEIALGTSDAELRDVIRKRVAQAMEDLRSTAT